MPKKKPPGRRRRGGPEGIYDRAMKALAAKEGDGKGAAAEVPDPSSSSEEDEGDYGARKCGGDVLAGVLDEGVAGGAGVLADIPAGETWSGYPAKPIRQSLREAVWLAKQTSPKGRA